MGYVAPEVVEQIKKIDLITYFQNCEPNELVRDSRTQYSTKTHSSLKMSNGYWNYFKGGFGGKNAVDYVEKMLGYKFPDSIEYILKMMNGKAISYIPRKEKTVDTILIVPERNTNENVIKKYLKARGIDEEIIKKCIERKLIFEEKYYHNVVFLGYDEMGNIRYAGCRSTNGSNFKNDATGSNKSYSFRLESNKKTNKIYVFEGAIDLLSFASLFKKMGENWEDKTMISLAGIYQPAKVIQHSKVPTTIKKYLDKHSEIDEIILCLDNDVAGRNATKALKSVLSDKYKVVDKPPKFCKDYNEYLCKILDIKPLENYKKLNRERGR